MNGPLDLLLKSEGLSFILDKIVDDISVEDLANLELTSQSWRQFIVSNASWKRKADQLELEIREEKDSADTDPSACHAFFKEKGRKARRRKTVFRLFYRSRFLSQLLRGLSPDGVERESIGVRLRQGFEEIRQRPRPPAIHRLHLQPERVEIDSTEPLQGHQRTERSPY